MFAEPVHEMLDFDTPIRYQQPSEVTCYRCKQVFPFDQTIGRRFHRYCKHCFWIDTLQMVAVGALIWITFIVGLLFYTSKS